jgi:CelD/BcsL family acetyltransferase involved in cellulose biosynthesis
MRSSFQRGVRKAKREGVTTERATTPAAMSTFYELHRSLRFGKFGKIPQPRRFFREIRKSFLDRDQGFVLQARRKGVVIGALVALRHRDMLYYKFGASAEDALEHRPNNLLFHDLLHHAVDEDLRAVDLGYSGAGESYSGLRRFKESFGGERHPITTFRVTPPGHDSTEEDELDDVLHRLTETVVEQQLDTEATDAFSEILYPYFA